jgi:hypothetical protein
MRHKGNIRERDASLWRVLPIRTTPSRSQAFRNPHVLQKPGLAPPGDTRSLQNVSILSKNTNLTGGR